MDGSPNRTFQVNELTPDPNVVFDPKVVKATSPTPTAWRRAGW
jgi:hypothetical protein